MAPGATRILLEASIRDYFAGQALDFALRVTADNDASFDHEAGARTAYIIADEMLKARLR